MPLSASLGFYTANTAYILDSVCIEWQNLKSVHNIKKSVNDV